MSTLTCRIQVSNSILNRKMMKQTDMGSSEDPTFSKPSRQFLDIQNCFGRPTNPFDVRNIFCRSKISLDARKTVRTSKNKFRRPKHFLDVQHFFLTPKKCLDVGFFGTSKKGRLRKSFLDVQFLEWSKIWASLKTCTIFRTISDDFEAVSNCLRTVLDCFRTS